jgi:thiol-disulfide isomerase/thioredoxin
MSRRLWTVLVASALFATGAPPWSEFLRGAKASLIFFILTDCPISNSYAPEIQRICKEYGEHGVSCSLVYEDLKTPSSTLRQHMKDYGYTGFHFFADDDRSIANRANAEITPEVALIDAKGEVRYRGRIDNLYAAIGKSRRNVTEHYLTDALEAVLAGKRVATPETKALGCSIVPANL